MIAQGQTPIGNTPAEAAANLRSDVEKWGALINGFGLKIE
jgi:hypothetical protein